MGKNKEFEIRSNFYHSHIDRQRGSRGNKPERLSLKDDLKRLGRELHIPVSFDR